MKGLRYFTLSTGLLLLLACPSWVHAEETEAPEVIEENVVETVEEEPIPEQPEILVEEEVSVEDNGITNDELFEKYVDEQFGIEQDIPEASPKKAARHTGVPLEGVNSVLYDLLEEKIEGVAAGEIDRAVFQFTAEDLQIDGVSYTAEELGVDYILDDGGSALLPEAKDQFFEKIGFKLAVVNKALLYNHPYELYWYDKSTSGAMRQVTSFSIGSGLSLTQMKIYMMVSADYSLTGETRTNDIDTELASSVQTAVQNADAIVAEYENLNDYDKLLAYKNKVCELTDYNDEAADSTTMDYGNPWQMIWVFDGNPDTTVVCEGYSKAFDYLCSKSTFENPNLDCYLVSGVMDDENHMWNIVTFGGSNYLVDVTNSDNNTVGYPDKLFLVGTSLGSAAYGYTIKAGTRSIDYTYDDSTKMSYTNAQLTLSQTAYIPPVKETKHSLSLEGNIGVNFYLDISDSVLSDDDAYVTFTVEDQSTNVYVRDAHITRLGGKQYYVFTAEVTSVQMTSDITARVYLSTGSAYYRDIFSVKAYCDQAIEAYAASNPKLVQLMKDLLNYGGYAQVAFNTNTDRLANADLEDTDVSDVTAETLQPYESTQSGSEEGLRYQNSTLTLNSLTTINHIFVVNNGHTIDEYEFKLGNQTLTPIKRGNKYYVVIPNIYSYDLDTPFTVTVGGYTISYSGLSYGYKALTSASANDDLKNLMRAMYKYNQSANVYFENA